MSNIIPGALSAGDPTCVLTVCGRIAAQVDCIKYIMQGTSACIDVQFFNVDGTLLDLDDFCDIQIQLTNEFDCVVANFWYPDVPTGSRGFDIEVLQHIVTGGRIANKGLLRICLPSNATVTSPSSIFAEILLKGCVSGSAADSFGVSCLQVAKITESKISKNGGGGGFFPGYIPPQPGSSGIGFAIGATGFIGGTGLGATGFTGSTGSGATGFTGLPGATGDAGLPGATGLAGSTGPLGSTGDAGLPGATGDAGLPGATGDAGLPGATGSSGFTGSTGPAISSPFSGNFNVQSGQAWVSADANGNTTASTTVNWNDSNIQTFTLNTATTTFTFSNGQAGATYILVIRQNATGSQTIVWPGSVAWSGNITPTMTATASRYDVFTFIFDGTKFFGSYIQNFT